MYVLLESVVWHGPVQSLTKETVPNILSKEDLIRGLGRLEGEPVVGLWVRRAAVYPVSRRALSVRAAVRGPAGARAGSRLRRPDRSC